MSVLANPGLHLFGDGCTAACPVPRPVLLLSTLQALFMTGNILVISTSALIGAALAPSPALAALPLALQLLATMLMSIPASLFMARAGRPAGFSLGAGVGILGALSAAVAITEGSFVLFLVASLLLGVFNAFGGFYRFAAAEAATPAYRGRAVSYVIAGGVVAAFAGPAIAVWSRTLLAAEFAGSYALLALVYLPAVLIPLWLRRPHSAEPVASSRGRSLPDIARQPVFLVAGLGAIVGYSVMAFLTTATPLAMDEHQHEFSATALVIQWHVLAMFVPSFFTGQLISRFGVLSVMLAGGLFGIGAVVTALAGLALGHFLVSLVLLGLSWNFLFIGGTTLLTESYRENERAKVQGLNDFLLYGVTAVASLSAGAVQSWAGWWTVNLAALPMLALVLAGVAWLALRRREEAFALC
jgi:MFS family permease